MTTGRINQVTIAGQRDPSRSPALLPSRGTVGLLAARPPPEGRRPTFTDSKRPVGDVFLQSLAHRVPTEGQRRAREPVASHSGRVDPKRVDWSLTNSPLACTRNGATPTALLAGTGLRGHPRLRVRRLLRNCRASRAMPQPERRPARGTPPGRSPEQRLSSITIVTPHRALLHKQQFAIR